MPSTACGISISHGAPKMVDRPSKTSTSAERRKQWLMGKFITANIHCALTDRQFNRYVTVVSPLFYLGLC